MGDESSPDDTIVDNFIIDLRAELLTYKDEIQNVPNRVSEHIRRKYRFSDPVTIGIDKLLRSLWDRVKRGRHVTSPITIEFVNEFTWTLHGWICEMIEGDPLAYNVWLSGAIPR
jgi:hypothetical protein